MAALGNGERASALAWRRRIFGDNRDPDRQDVQTLIAVGRTQSTDPEIAALLAEVALEVFVTQANPSGYITDDNADWLIKELADGGGLACAAEFDLLKTLIGHAVCVPPALIAFAVREVEKAILTGRRDALGGADHEPGIVTQADVEALRALAFAPARGALMHVDRGTAEVLFDIAHATATADNAPEFVEFFAKAVGNYLTGANFLETPDACEVLALESELDKPSGFGAFFSAVIHNRMDLHAASRSVEEAQEEQDRAANLAGAHNLEAASHIDAVAAKWVIMHLTRGGQLTLAERRLLAFLRDEAASAPAELEALYAQAA